MTFTRIALQKITELIHRKEFVEIAFIDEKKVTIIFKGRACNVTSLGNVTWDDLDED